MQPHSELDFVPLWNYPENPSHRWRTEISSLVAGAECSECAGTGKSRVKLQYFEDVRRLLVDARSGARYNDPGFTSRWSLDISLRCRGHTVTIEYDGAHWHLGKENVDKRQVRGAAQRRVCGGEDPRGQAPLARDSIKGLRKGMRGQFDPQSGGRHRVHQREARYHHRELSTTLAVILRLASIFRYKIYALFRRDGYYI